MQVLRRFLALVFVILALAAPAHATVTQVGAATGTTTCTPTTHAIGDLIVIYAYRSGSTTAPTLGSGYQSILTKSGTSSSARIGFKVATATNDASGTWTNASHVTCLVYRSSNYATGSSLYIGGSASSSSTTTTVNYPALTMIHGDTTSWAIGFAGTSVATAALSTHAPSGMTFFTGSDVTATTEVTAFDTNGAVSSWSSTNTTVGAAGNSVSATVELIENQPGTAINNIVQRISSGYTPSTGTPENTLVYNFDASLSGNGYVVAVCYPSGLTPAITDNQSNTWPASGAAGTVTADAGAGNMALQIFRLASATTGTSQITISFGTGTGVPVKTWITQLYNITGTMNSTSGWNATAVNASGIVSPGSQTPTNNNANGGNLILSYACDSATSSTTNPALIVPETGYSLNDADISWTNGQGTNGIPNASQFFLQATSAATVPRFYLNAGGADTYNVAAIALSVGVQGTLPATGAGNAPFVNGIAYFGTNTTTATLLAQVPSTGNCAVIMNLDPTSASPHVTAISDSDGASWVLQQPSVGTSIAYTNINQTPKPNRTISISISANNLGIHPVYYDVGNCHTSPIAATAGTTSFTADGLNAVSAQPSITPTATNQLTIAYLQNGFGPSTAVTAPSGAVYDSPTVQTWKGTGSITTTTLTRTATTWGTVPLTLTNILSGASVTAGTTVTAATDPTYTIRPSQTAVSETMFLSGNDGDQINWGNGSGHFSNGSSLSAQSWSYNIANQPSNSVTSFAIIFNGPPASVGGTPLRSLMGVGQ